MSDTIPAAPDSLATAMRSLAAGNFHGLRDPQSLKVSGTHSAQARQYIELVDRGWATHAGGEPQLTDAGASALALNDLGLRGMTVSQARLLLAVSRDEAVKVGHDTKVRVDDRGRETYHLAPAIPVYLDRKYGLAELLPNRHTWQLTDAGKQAVELLAAQDI